MQQLRPEGVYFGRPMYRSRLLSSCGRLSVMSVCLCVTTVSSVQTARRIELIFGANLLLPKCYHVLGVPPLFGEIRGSKVLGSMGRYRKISSCRGGNFVQRLLYAQETCLPTFSSIVHKIVDLEPQSLRALTPLFLRRLS